MPSQKASLRLHSYPKRRDKPFAVVMELPERVEYFLSYHETLYRAELAFAKALETDHQINWYQTILEFVMEYLSKSPRAITEAIMMKDIMTTGNNPKSHITDDLKRDFKERYEYLR